MKKISADTLLIIEDEKLFGSELKHRFEKKGWEVILVDTYKEALQLLTSAAFDPLLILADLRLPDGNTIELLEKSRQSGITGEWVFLTGKGGIQDSVNALRLGAFDFLEKPCDPEHLELVTETAAKSAKNKRRIVDETKSRSAIYSPSNFIGKSREATAVRDFLTRLSQVDFSSLIISGETGTGKGLAARILHHSGLRSEKRLIEVNCAAFPKDLLESELFGYEPGAFTGAQKRRRGLFEQADGGTLFLDEIGEMDLAVQAKILKAIEDKTFRRLGSEKDISVDIQIIAASNRDLKKSISEGIFRADLYHRLNVLGIELPPLKNRLQDIKDLTITFIAFFSNRIAKPVSVVPDEVWEHLEGYSWPGNVRELRNVIERCVLLSKDGIFPVNWLRMEEADRSAGTVADGDMLSVPLDGSLPLDRIECDIIQSVLDRNNSNVSATARILGMSREKLRYRISRCKTLTGGTS